MRTILTFLTLLFALPLAAQQTYDAETLRQLQKFMRVYRYVDDLYVDSVSMGPLVERAIEGMLEELDPHSAYITAEQMRGVEESMQGEFIGIGIEFALMRDTVVVVGTVAGGPAERVGMRPADRIVRIDTVSAVGFRQADVPRHLRGQLGSRVALEVVRRGEARPLRFQLTRGRIPLTTVDAAYMATDRIGYIRVNRFGRTTMEEFRQAYRSLGNPKGLILDLRGNGGGLLEAAIEMAGFFLPRGARVVSTEGRGVEPHFHETQSPGEAMRGPLAVLVDEASASGSEIVAGAVQDWDRGIIVGRTTFGKGLVQRQVPLGDGSAMRITIARYHTPSGRVIQRPYEPGRRGEYYRDHLRRRGGTEPGTADTAAPAYRTLRTGRTVYGGGGIRPDVFVAADTTGYSPYYAGLVRSGALNEYAMAYLDRERDHLKRSYPDIDAFEASFCVTEGMIDALAALGVERGVEEDREAIVRSGDLIRLQLKALIGERLFGEGAFYRVMNRGRDGAYARAVELLGKWDEECRPMLKG